MRRLPCLVDSARVACCAKWDFPRFLPGNIETPSEHHRISLPEEEDIRKPTTLPHQNLDTTQHEACFTNLRILRLSLHEIMVRRNLCAADACSVKLDAYQHQHEAGGPPPQSVKCRSLGYIHHRCRSHVGALFGGDWAVSSLASPSLTDCLVQLALTSLGRNCRIVRTSKHKLSVYTPHLVSFNYPSWVR